MSIISKTKISEIKMLPQQMETFRWSPDCSRVAYVTKEGGPLSKRFHVVCNDGVGPPFKAVQHLSFSPCGQHIAYIVKKETDDREWVMIVDGNMVGQYDEVGEPVFSPDGKHLAYPAKSGGKWFIVLDGNKERCYDEVSLPIFDSTGQRVAYKAKSEKKWKVIVDGNEFSQYDNIYQMSFSPCGRNIAFTAEIGSGLWSSPKTTVVVNGVEGKKYKELSAQILKPKARRGLYGGIMDLFIWPAQKAVTTLTSRNSLIWSPTGSHLAYIVSEDEQNAFIVVAGNEQQRYIACSLPVFSQDSSRLGYAAKKFKGDAWTIVIDSKEYYALCALHDPNLPNGTVVTDNNLFPKLTTEKNGTLFHDVFIGTPIFSPNGLRVAIGGFFSDWGWWIYVDNEASIRPYLSIGDQGPVFSPDSTHVAYCAILEMSSSAIQKSCVVMDGNEGKTYCQVGAIAFSPDSNILSYIVEPLTKSGGSGRVHVVLGNTESDGYDGVFSPDGPRAPLKFVSPGRVLYIARVGNDFYRIEQSVV